MIALGGFGRFDRRFGGVGVEYARVAMRIALVDRTLDRASGRLVDGSESPQEVTELWTFMRSGHGQWLLSAIQQA